jgi:hypothetical protein
MLLKTGGKRRAHLAVVKLNQSVRNKVLLIKRKKSLE